MSGFHTLQIYPRVYRNIFRVKRRVFMRLIFFTVLIQKSDKQWEVLSGCLKNLPRRIPSGLKSEGKYFQTIITDFPLFVPHYSAVQCSALLYCTVQYSALQCSAMQSSSAYSVQCYTVKFRAVQMSAVHSVQCYTVVQLSRVELSSVYIE